MNLNQKNAGVFLKKVFQRVFLPYGHTSKFAQIRGQNAADEIYRLLRGENPCFIGRIGSTEIHVLIAFQTEPKLVKKFSYLARFFWNDVIEDVCTSGGYFPPEKEALIPFNQIMLESIAHLDLMGTWRKEEVYLKKELHHVTKIPLNDLEAYKYDLPWSRILKGMKVLIIHPFTESIRSQYEKRAHLFANQDVLPDFHLESIKAVQSIAGTEVPYKSWVDALDSMKAQIDQKDFDIALIGCGAYGFPLGAYVKSIGKKAVHIGGSLQLLFGIMGKRWESRPEIARLKNEHWIYPTKSETPENKDKVDHEGYW